MWRETLCRPHCTIFSTFQSTPSVWRETSAVRLDGVLFSYFNPLPPCGGRPIIIAYICAKRNFNPLPPCGGRHQRQRRQATIDDFNPLPPCGGRRSTLAPQSMTTYFNPLPPCGGRHLIACRPLVRLYFNPLPPCGGRLTTTEGVGKNEYFNPLPPCGGRRSSGGCANTPTAFQSTPSVWRETLKPCPFCGGVANFNPLPPCGGRLSRDGHSQRERIFQSTPSVWRETHIYDYRDLEDDISIHSLRVEGDEQRSHGPFRDIHFNPLPPCGGRLVGSKRARMCLPFQSTPSVWRETR